MPQKYELNQFTQHQMFQICSSALSESFHQIFITHLFVFYTNPFRQSIISIKIGINMMLQSMTSVKHDIWSKLAAYFNKYKGEDGEMSTSSMERFIVEVLGERQRDERDYVMNNFFRVDLDSNGTVSFFELGSFLFSEHCIEISLQRHHKMRKMTYGHLKKMTFPEFIYLINQAYKFLSVTITEAEGRKVFNSMDTDRDDLITYEQYFSILHVNACTNELPAEMKILNESGRMKKMPERHSKLKKYMWEQLKKLFDSHMKGKSLPANMNQLRRLISDIVGDFNSDDIDFLLYYLGMEESNSIKFEPMASKFIEVAARLGLRKFMKNHLQSKTNLNKYEFARLLKESFRFLDLGRFKDSILFKIFQKIDKNHDGWISYEEYMDWIIRFLAAGQLRNGQFLALEDDLDADSTVALEMEVDHNTRRSTMVFSDYSLAKLVRKRTKEIILTHIHMKDGQRLINKSQIQKVIRAAIKTSQNSLKYLIAGVFREDEGDKGSVTLEQFVNFMIELYYGESAIQILHIKDAYQQGGSRKMSRPEFKKTISLMLSYLSMQPHPRLLDTLFDEIDYNKTNQITYREYFTFNIYYFGKSSMAALNISDFSRIPRLSQDQYFVWTHRHLSPYGRFKTMIMSQVKDQFKHYGWTNMEVIEPDNIRQILKYVFRMSDVEIQYTYRKLFNYLAQKGRMADLTEAMELIIACCFELHLAHKSASRHLNQQKESLIDFQQFWELVVDLCRFVPVKPICEDLLYIFNDTDINKDAHISWYEYSDLVKHMFVVHGIYNEYLSETKETSNSQISSYESKFIKSVEDALRRMFGKMKENETQVLNRSDVQAVCKQMKMFSNRQVKFIIWSLFDTELSAHKPRRQVNFHQFSSFIINYMGEVSLEKFHVFQSAPFKNELLYAEFYLIIHNTFSPLINIEDCRDTVSKISKKIGKSNQLTYSKFLNWLHESFVVANSKIID